MRAAYLMRTAYLQTTPIVGPSARLLAARAKEDDQHADQADDSPEEIPAVRFESIEQAPPQQRQGDEHAAIGRIDAPEVLLGWKWE